MNGTRCELEALTRLLDDPSPSVHTALVSAFRSHGAPALEGLRRIAGRREDPRSAHAAAMLSELGDADHAGAFRRFILAGRHDLERGCLLMERVIRPAADPLDLSEPLDMMTSQVREIMPDKLTIRDVCRVINRVVFHEWGFRGDPALFLSPDGSLISRVLDARAGIPISLCIVYLLVARRLNLPIEAMALPGRFMLGYRPGDSEGFFVDCFDGGVFRTRTEVKLILLQNGLPATDDWIVPASVGETLCRCCRNLASQFSSVGDADRAGLFSGFVQDFESLPDDDA